MTPVERQFDRKRSNLPAAAHTAEKSDAARALIVPIEILLVHADDRAAFLHERFQAVFQFADFRALLRGADVEDDGLVLVEIQS